MNYPDCDKRVQELAAELWSGDEREPYRVVGKGSVSYDLGAAQAAGEPDPVKRELYPSYDATAQMLSHLGTNPDFEADGGLRYIHRRDGDTDIFFVANREDQPFRKTCQFRVNGRQPEWWDPMTGECRDLPCYRQENGLYTTVPLRLEAFQSGFVIFRKPGNSDAFSGENFPQPQLVYTFNAPWEASFDPKWGAPEKVVFNNLEDWSKRPDLQHYSGKAVYRTTFDRPTELKDGRCWISLGNVKNIASVKLNDKDLGVAWCTPWRLEVPAGLVQPKDNRIEITVANLWINRLIGDSALPEDKRATWTTYNPFKPDSPLQESGLLGPVTLMQ
jgi:hypothetical protein